MARGHPPPSAWNSPLPSALPRRTPDPHPASEPERPRRASSWEDGYAPACVPSSPAPPRVLRRGPWALHVGLAAAGVRGAPAGRPPLPLPSGSPALGVVGPPPLPAPSQVSQNKRVLHPARHVSSGPPISGAGGQPTEPKELQWGAGPSPGCTPAPGPRPGEPPVSLGLFQPAPALPDHRNSQAVTCVGLSLSQSGPCLGGELPGAGAPGLGAMGRSRGR